MTVCQSCLNGLFSDRFWFYNALRSPYEWKDEDSIPYQTQADLDAHELLNPSYNYFTTCANLRSLTAKNCVWCRHILSSIESTLISVIPSTGPPKEENLTIRVRVAIIHSGANDMPQGLQVLRLKVVMTNAQGYNCGSNSDFLLYSDSGEYQLEASATIALNCYRTKPILQLALCLRGPLFVTYARRTPSLPLWNASQTAKTAMNFVASFRPLTFAFLLESSIAPIQHAHGSSLRTRHAAPTLRSATVGARLSLTRRLWTSSHLTCKASTTRSFPRRFKMRSRLHTLWAYTIYGSTVCVSSRIPSRTKSRSLQIWLGSTRTRS